MSILDQIANKIIKEQELIIGPVAWYEAKKVQGLNITGQNGEVRIDSDNTSVIDSLVKQYEHLFGRASREVCREAAAPLLATLGPDQIPASLR